MDVSTVLCVLHGADMAKLDGAGLPVTEPPDARADDDTQPIKTSVRLG